MLKAAIIASLVPAILFVLLGVVGGDSLKWATTYFIVTFLTVLTCVVTFGIPIILLLRMLNALNWPSVVAVGFVVSTVLAIIAGYVSQIKDYGHTLIYDSQVLIKDGVITSSGWLEIVINAGAFGIVGAVVSGVYFWLCLKMSPNQAFKPTGHKKPWPAA